MSFMNNNGDDTCEPEDLDASEEHLPGTNLNLRQLFIVVGAVATAVTVLNCALVFLSHFIWRVKHREQKHLVRVAILPAVFAFFYWMGIVIYGRQPYLSPWVGIYEVYTLTNFFEYEVEVIVPDGKTRAEVMVETPRMSGKKQKHPNGSYRWYRVCRMFVYTGLFLHTIVTLAQMVIARTLCHTGSQYERLNTAFELIGIVATMMALLTLLKFYARFSKQYAQHRLFLTFFIYKAVVLLYILETLVITILENTDAVATTRYMSYADFHWGVHSFMVVCQSCIFSFLYLPFVSGWLYRARSRAAGMGSSGAKGGYGPIGASGSRHPPDFTKGKLLLDVFFPKEPFTGFWEGLRTLAGLFGGRRRFDYTAGTGATHQQRVAAKSIFAQRRGFAQEETAYAGQRTDPESDEYELLPKPPGSRRPSDVGRSFDGGRGSDVGHGV